MEEFENPSATRGESKRIVYPVRPSSTGSTGSTGSRKEIMDRIRRDLKKQREELSRKVMKISPSHISNSSISHPFPQQPSDQEEEEEEEEQREEPSKEERDTQSNEQERKKLATALKKEQEREKLFRPDSISPTKNSTPTSPSASTSITKPPPINGWTQSDGRYAEQMVIYDHPLPKHIRARLEPVKENHFRFRNKSDEKALLDSLSSSSQTADYQSTGKKDVTLTSTDGRLLGNIHFLHVDRPNVHNPDKYYMKFYLYNFADSSILRDTKQRILEFTKSFGSSGNRAPKMSYLSSSRKQMSRHRVRYGKKIVRDMKKRHTFKRPRRNLK